MLEEQEVKQAAHYVVSGAYNLGYYVSGYLTYLQPDLYT